MRFTPQQGAAIQRITAWARHLYTGLTRAADRVTVVVD